VGDDVAGDGIRTWTSGFRLQPEEDWRFGIRD
jgi:hypothetical protein